jgi:exopolysaccharide biosynthesis protein
MISRLLSITAVSAFVAGGFSVAHAAEDAALSREVQGMLINRGYLADYHKDWDQCAQRAAAAFLSDDGKASVAPELREIAEELKEAPADVRRAGEPVC